MPFSFVVSALLACSLALGADGFQPLCEHLNMRGDLSPGLTNTEKRLVCGYSTDENDYDDPAWEKVPFNQAKFHLTSFLQDRGYHHPVFGLEGDKRWVDIGKQTLVQSFALEGVEDTIRVRRKRKIIGAPLTPKLLEGLEKWTYEKLQTVGYGCPTLSTTANSDTGEIRIRVLNTRLQNLTEVTEDPLHGLEPCTLDRYSAYRLNEPFNGDLMILSKNRINGSGIVENNNFVYSCKGDGVKAHRIIIPGRPRMLSAGAGIDTEGIVRGRVNWRNARIGRYGSLFDVTALGSARAQSLKTALNAYIWPYVTRKYISSSITFTHENQWQQYEILSLSGQTGFSTTFDRPHSSGNWFVGPTADINWTLQGTGAPVSKFLFLENRLNWKSKDFEFFAASPTAGYNMGLTVDLSHPAFGTDVSIQRVTFNGAYLVNFKDYDPPLFIFAFRWGFGTLLTPSRNIQNNLIPANYYQFLGGATSVRGFGLKEIPREDDPRALTSGFLGVEGRLVDTLPYGLEPFIFYDAGAISRRGFRFEAPLYTSPGIGIRWSSPIGVSRFTIARGFSGSELDHFQFFFNFGQEF